MNDFEVLSRDAAESGEPVEPKRDVEAPVEPETVRRVRVGLDALTAELAEAKEAVAYLEARENELLAEKAELARSLAEAQKKREEFAVEARLAVKRFRNALDAARNDVAIYRRAALWFAAATLSAVVAWGAAAF
ncbi:MAG: hypothetical protein J6K25_15675 [Thermoguttaceae bacterium]|nr:hypothetical protein [Thermoguttaceae bacterium]